MDGSGIATRQQLRQAGLSSGDIGRAVETGDLVRLRRGWYGTPETNSQITCAVRAGGSLSCASALVVHGVWMRQVRQLHVAFASGAHRSTPATAVAHWSGDAGADGPLENPLHAFRRFSRCGSPLDVVIAADSLLNLGLVTLREIDSVLRNTARGRRQLERVDGSAESGTETMVRVRLRARGIDLRTQVPIAGVGRVDFVLGDRLVIEVDGREWHDEESQFEKDRARDARLVAMGYIVMRFTYRRVMFDLAAVEREILAVVRAGEHRRRPVRERVARNYG